MTDDKCGQARSAFYQMADALVEVLALFGDQAGPNRAEGGEQEVPTGALADLPPVLTVRETAVILRVGRNTVYEGIRAGTTPSVRVGRRIVVPTSSLLRLFERRMSVSNPGPRA